MLLNTLLAHAGHDHTYTVAGEWHHVFWLVFAAGVIAGLVWAIARFAKAGRARETTKALRRTRR